MSRIGPTRGRSISAVRIAAAVPSSSPRSRCSSSKLVSSPACEAEPAAHRDALRVPGAGLVEGAGHRRPPVQHHRLAGVVGDVPPADVVACPAWSAPPVVEGRAGRRTAACSGRRPARRPGGTACGRGSRRCRRRRPPPSPVRNRCSARSRIRRRAARESVRCRRSSVISSARCGQGHIGAPRCGCPAAARRSGGPGAGCAQRRAPSRVAHGPTTLRARSPIGGHRLTTAVRRCGATRQVRRFPPAAVRAWATVRDMEQRRRPVGGRGSGTSSSSTACRSTGA